jgi:hypothetical protein
MRKEQRAKKDSFLFCSLFFDGNVTVIGGKTMRNVEKNVFRGNKLDKLEKEEMKILWDLILLYRRLPNVFTYEQIGVFSHFWRSYKEAGKYNRGYSGISEKAKERAKSLGLPIETWRYYKDWIKHNTNWKEQSNDAHIQIAATDTGKKLYSDGGRYSPEKKIFHAEHHLPRSQITQMLIDDAKGIEDVKEILSESGFYIITSEENRLLEKEWRSKRPLDAYDRLGIKIDYDFWKNKENEE